MSDRGYHWYAARGKYRARIIHRGKAYHLGYHQHEADAKAAADEGRRQLGVDLRPTTAQNAAALAAWFIAQGRMARDGDLHELIKETV